MNAAEQAVADAAAARDADLAEAKRQTDVSVAEGKKRDELRAQAEQLAKLAVRDDKAAAADEILHALMRPF